METLHSVKESFLKGVNILEIDLLAVLLMRAVVVHWNSFLIQSSGSGVAVGFHELPISQKDRSKDYTWPRANVLS